MNIHRDTRFCTVWEEMNSSKIRQKRALLELMPCKCCLHVLHNPKLESRKNTLYDFLLWDSLKSRVYRGNSQSLLVLKNTIRQKIAAIFAEVLFHAALSVILQLYSVLECGSGHIEPLHLEILLENSLSFQNYNRLFF